MHDKTARNLSLESSSERSMKIPPMSEHTFSAKHTKVQKPQQQFDTETTTPWHDLAMKRSKSVADPIEDDDSTLPEKIRPIKRFRVRRE